MSTLPSTYCPVCVKPERQCTCARATPPKSAVELVKWLWPDLKLTAFQERVLRTLDETKDVGETVVDVGGLSEGANDKPLTRTYNGATFVDAKTLRPYIATGERKAGRVVVTALPIGTYREDGSVVKPVGIDRAKWDVAMADHDFSLGLQCRNCHVSQRTIAVAINSGIEAPKCADNRRIKPAELEGTVVLSEADMKNVYDEMNHLTVRTILMTANTKVVSKVLDLDESNEADTPVCVTSSYVDRK